MISSVYYCPQCGEIWNMELCENCGHEDEDRLEVPKKYKKRDDEEKSHKERRK
jgi:rRNA maturation endonuclease Nob1